MYRRVVRRKRREAVAGDLTRAQTGSFLQGASPYILLIIEQGNELRVPGSPANTSCVCRHRIESFVRLCFESLHATRLDLRSGSAFLLGSVAVRYAANSRYKENLTPNWI